MPKNNKKSRKQGTVSKLMNIGLIALSFSRVIEIIAVRLAHGASQHIAADIIHDATFGLADGNFDMAAGMRMYLPAGGAVALGYLKSYALRKWPVRK